MLPEFELWTPQTLPDALAQLSTAGSEAIPLSGGTNVIPDLRSGRHTPKIVMDVSRLAELRGLSRQNGHIQAGGSVTLSELLASPLVSEHAAPLTEAARLFANPIIRNRATLAGNLVDASPAADTAPPLLVLDAEVDLVSQGGCRTIPLQDFFIGVRKTTRRSDELLVNVRWEAVKPNTGFAYYKLGLRKADAISVVSLAVRLEAEPDGRCRTARIAMGSVAPRPLRALAAEDSLHGQLLNEEAFARAGQLAAEAVSPISDLRASDAYRRRMVAVLVQRLLRQAASEIWKAG